MDEPFAHSNVPAGSTLKVTVSGQGDPDQQFFVAHGSFERPDRSSEEWADSELRAGLPRLLAAAGPYLGRLDIHFFKESTARVQMEIRDGAGNLVDSYDQSFTQASNFDRTFILLVVRSNQPAQPAAPQGGGE